MKFFLYKSTFFFVESITQIPKQIFNFVFAILLFFFQIPPWYYNKYLSKYTVLNFTCCTYLFSCCVSLLHLLCASHPAWCVRSPQLTFSMMC